MIGAEGSGGAYVVFRFGMLSWDSAALKHGIELRESRINNERLVGFYRAPRFDEPGAQKTIEPEIGLRLEKPGSYMHYFGVTGSTIKAGTGVHPSLLSESFISSGGTSWSIGATEFDIFTENKASRTAAKYEGDYFIFGKKGFLSHVALRAGAEIAHETASSRGLQNESLGTLIGGTGESAVENRVTAIAYKEDKVAVFAGLAYETHIGKDFIFEIGASYLKGLSKAKLRIRQYGPYLASADVVAGTTPFARAGGAGSSITSAYFAPQDNRDVTGTSTGAVYAVGLTYNLTEHLRLKVSAEQMRVSAKVDKVEGFATKSFLLQMVTANPANTSAVALLPDLGPLPTSVDDLKYLRFEVHYKVW